MSKQSQWGWTRAAGTGSPSVGNITALMIMESRDASDTSIGPTPRRMEEEHRSREGRT